MLVEEKRGRQGAVSPATAHTHAGTGRRGVPRGFMLGYQGDGLGREHRRCDFP
jgi:hypothetical protein